jgi:hypothetical protein
MNTLIKTVTAACVALVLASFLGASAQTGYQFKTVEWWKAGKGFIGGEQSASSAYSAWAVCTPPRASSLLKRCPVLAERDMLQFS